MLLISNGSVVSESKSAFCEKKIINEKEKRQTSGLKELHDGPYSNVHERRIGAGEEAVQIPVHSTVRLVPHIAECRVVVWRITAI
jgi:hypothetical protein